MSRQTIIYITTTITYNLYYHSLRHYPGPKAHAATSLPWGLSLLRGTLPRDIHALHETYGRVVRVRPNELAFADAQSWQDIYGHKVTGKRAGLAPGAKEIPKYIRFYKSHPRQPDSLILSGHKNHTRWRRMMAPGFSEKSMRAQEPLIMRYVDLLMARLRERSGEAVNIVKWYNWTTFDIIEDLAFGDASGSLEHSRRHPFVALINGSFKQASRLVFLRYMGLPKLSYLALFSLLRKGFAMRGHGASALRRRIASPDPRPDLIEPLLSERGEGGLSFKALSIMASGLLLAGSETTASTLSGVTWLLLSNPEKLEKLTREVRDTFGCESEISFTSVQGLGYMLACLNEGLRMYPPVAIGLPRQVPKGGAMMSGDYVPEWVSRPLRPVLICRGGLLSGRGRLSSRSISGQRTTYHQAGGCPSSSSLSASWATRGFETTSWRA